MKSKFINTNNIVFLHSMQIKDCCEACKIGLVIGSTSPQCSTDAFSFGSPWDDIIEDCCSDIRDGDSEPESTETESKYTIHCINCFSICQLVCAFFLFI